MQLARAQESIYVARVVHFSAGSRQSACITKVSRVQRRARRPLKTLHSFSLSLLLGLVTGLTLSVAARNTYEPLNQKALARPGQIDRSGN